MFGVSSKDSDFDKIFYEKRYLIEKIARKYSKSQSMLEDLVQQVFLTIYLNLGKVLSAENKDGYIHTLAVNEIMGYFRKKKHNIQTVAFTDEMESVISAVEKNSEQDIYLEQISENLISLLSTLPDKRRNVVILRILEEKTFREISEILLISEVSARNLFSMGIKNVRQLMEKYKEKSYAFNRR